MHFSPILTSIFRDISVTTEINSERALIEGLKDNAYHMISLSHKVEEPGLIPKSVARSTCRLH